MAKTFGTLCITRDGDSVLRGVALDLAVMARESENNRRGPGRSKWRRRLRRLA